MHDERDLRAVPAEAQRALGGLDPIDQALDSVDFVHLNQRLRANSAQEKLTNLFLSQILEHAPGVLKVLRNSLPQGTKSTHGESDHRVPLPGV